MSTGCLWQARQPQALCWREWDDEVVLYNDATGSTHHLSSLGGEVMLALLRHLPGLEMSALVRVIDERVELPDGMDVAAEVSRVLGELAELQLAACVPA